MNIFSVLDQTARRFGERRAVFSGDECFATWAELRHRALSIGAALQSRFAKGDRIAVAAENRPEYVEILFGIWAAECVAVPLNYKLHAREMAQIVADAAAAAVFVSPKLAPDLDKALPAQDGRAALVVIGTDDYDALIRHAPAEVPRTPPESLAWLFYTSGTTGTPKGAMLSHRNLMAMSIAHLADVDTPDEDASLIHAAPMSHGSGLYIPAYVSRGARQVVPAGAAFDEAEFLDLCRLHPACSAFLAPTMVQRLCDQAEHGGARPANLRTIIYGGGPMYVEHLKRALSVFGPVFVQIYGQGEAPMTVTCLRRADHQNVPDSILASVGFARSGVEVAVVDNDDQPVGLGESGEIIVRGDVVMSGYWNNPAATSETLRGGWLHTGDVGAFDARGYLTLKDRSKDVVISGGSNIYPREVEEALLTAEGVSEVCVVGAPDLEWGEIVVAFVVRTDCGQINEQQLDAHCLEQIARFKRPKRYVFVESLPKNSYGKVLKRELRALVPT
ncbi:AMP-binding protein [Nevskia sp.]|uniref:AMP-binding protein n=1 Tax=Nevskia sp. TaxID=1929292 RepID=UPI0025DA3649|nr:AMP-binding protein [Nevskia sp.]